MFILDSSEYQRKELEETIPTILNTRPQYGDLEIRRCFLSRALYLWWIVYKQILLYTRTVNNIMRVHSSGR